MAQACKTEWSDKVWITQLTKFENSMNPPKCDDQDYINFLVATPRAFSALEAARVQPPAID
jgi:hypothetical protein